MPLIDLDVERAIHGLGVVLLALDVHRRVHVFLVEAQVPGSLPQPGPADVRRENPLVAVFEVSLTAEVFDQDADHGAFGVP